MAKVIKHGTDSWYGRVIEVIDNEDGTYSYKGIDGDLKKGLSKVEALKMFDYDYHLKPYNACRNAVVRNALAWCGKTVCNGRLRIGAKVELIDPPDYEKWVGKVAEIGNKGVKVVLPRGVHSSDWIYCDESDLRVLNSEMVCNGYMTLRKKGGGTSKVYDGDEVEYKGRLLTVKAVGSPQTDKITLDDNGAKVVVKGDDGQLFAVNAEPVAKNDDYKNFPKKQRRFLLI